MNEVMAHRQELLESDVGLSADAIPILVSGGGDYYSVDRFPPSASIYSESLLVTDEHEFIFQVRLEEAADLPKCNASFENIECGIFEAMASNDFDILATWLSQRLVTKIAEASAEGPEHESAQRENQNDDRLARCTEDGIERARALK